MPATERMSVPIALGSASTDTEEGRAFLQERLRLYAGWVFLLTFGFYLLNATLLVLVDPTLLGHPGNLSHLGAALTLGAVWVTTRLAARSVSSLARLDAAAVILACLFFAAMGSQFALQDDDFALDPVHSLLIGQLACMSTVVTRAVAVPSTPRRTFWLGAIALLPQIGFGAYVLFATERLPSPPGVTLDHSQLAIGNVMNLVGWCAVALAISTIASNVIFGLRAQADKIKRLGQYTLEEKLGEGGMGIVYRARHAMLKRPTAVKLLPPDKTGEESIRRFEREVQLTSRLSHPSTIAIFDFGRTPAGVFYYAMEFLDGLNLDELVEENGRQPPGRVIHILRQVSGALAEAHAHGLIHRDIKPANIILSERGGVPDVAKVVDFGLVKPITTNDTDATVRLTDQHVLTGTPMYMAPEAIKGERFVDGRSDLYALGAVGYFLLAGAPMFTSTRLVEVIGHHLHTVPEPLSVRRPGDVPPDLEAVLMRCLAKSPDERFATAEALADALDECGRATPWPVAEAARWWSRRVEARTAASPPPVSGTDPLPTLSIDLEGRIQNAEAPATPREDFHRHP